MRFLALVLVGVAASGGVAAAKPSGDPAAEGREALAAGRVREALGLLKRAAREEPGRVEIWCEIGLAHERLGQMAQAHAFLTRCLAGVPRPPEGAEAARRRVGRAVGGGRYAPVAFDVQPEGAELRISPFGADELLVAPIDLWLPFGTHRFTLRSPGYEEDQGEVVVGSDARQMVAVTLRRSGSSVRGQSAASVDFSVEADVKGPAVDAPIVAPDQRPLEHETLMPERFRGPKAGSTGGARIGAAPRPPPAPSTPPPPAPSTQMRIMSWNVDRFGQGRKDMSLLARQFEGQDVVILHEVMLRAAVQRLADYLPGWGVVLSRPVGRRGRTEHYVVFYRSNRVSVRSSFTVDDPADKFERDPFVACLAAREFDFCALAIHVESGNSEVQALGPLLEGLMRGKRERDWIVAGSFEQPARAASWRPLEARGWIVTARGRVATGIGADGYRGQNDHLLVNREHTREWTRRGDRLDFVELLCGGDFNRCRRFVSDHAPIDASFSTAGPDDD